MKINDLKAFIRSNGYAWPGGYPCALLMADGEVLDKIRVDDFTMAREYWKAFSVIAKNGGKP
jgi:hypothetical protein